MGDSVRLSVEVAGISLKNPLILASGILGLSAATLLRVAKQGAGAVIWKDIGPKPRKGHPNPTIYQRKEYMLNAMGMSNPGVDAIGEEMAQVASKVPTIANIFGENEEEFVEVATKCESYGAHALELNVSCPNIKPGERVGSTIGKSPELVEKITSRVKRAVRIPVFVKLTPNVTDVTIIAKAAERGGADGLTCFNTWGPGMAINIEMGKPVLANKFGGVSGPAIKPLTIAGIYKVYEVVSIPIMGCGGITTGQDALEAMMAGARAVQIGSGVFYRGIEVFSLVRDEMERWLLAHGETAVENVIGRAHREERKEKK